jgi:hypothetical protein
MIILGFLYHFGILMSEIFFKKIKKKNFDILSSKKHFKKQLSLYYQTLSLTWSLIQALNDLVKVR